jgi:putative hydrolase of the HAD superfamily
MIELVGVDADDTLWHNEPLYTHRRERFRELLARYEPEGVLDDHLYEVELRNLRHFGYGVKGFVLSMIETAIEITHGRLESHDISRIIDWGREMLSSPTELLTGVSDAIESLGEQFPLVLVTKGDLLDQQSKLARSGLAHHFKGIEIVSEKDAGTYARVMARYAVDPRRFVMVGNSLRSDILPAIQAGAHAVYVPYEMSWIHERVPAEALADVHYHEIAHMRELPPLLHRLDED